jgi:hypothetical protein
VGLLFARMREMGIEVDWTISVVVAVVDGEVDER